MKLTTFIKLLVKYSTLLLLLSINNKVLSQVIDLSKPSVYNGYYVNSDQKTNDSTSLIRLPAPHVEKISQSIIPLSNNTLKTMSATGGDLHPHIPNIHTISTTGLVAEIPLNSEVSPQGAMNYSVPIELPLGNNGFKPNLSLNYNSYNGEGNAGVGWSLNGFSAITRTNSSPFFDGRSHPLNLSNDGPFALDGIRLVRETSSTTEAQFRTYQGYTRVIAYLDGDKIKYFKVSYPNGHVGIFGYENGTGNNLIFPLTKLYDNYKNEISFGYLYDKNVYYLYKIIYGASQANYYNHAEINIEYVSKMSTDFYLYGIKMENNRVISKITIKEENSLKRTYDLKYNSSYGKLLLNQIDCSIQSNSGQITLNPLKFYYGFSGNSTNKWNLENKPLTYYLSLSDTEFENMTALKGKLNWGSNEDAVAMHVTKNPYKLETGSKLRYVNEYIHNDQLYYYLNIGEDKNTFIGTIPVGTGFIQALIADIDGVDGDEVIKINNTVTAGGGDLVNFSVYQQTMTGGGLELISSKSKSWDLAVALRDSKGNTSVHPKLYFAGDFNGDGKSEILAYSIPNPLGQTIRSKIYIFDLLSKRITYEGFSPINYTPGDLLFAMDYDGDGKTDLCHVNKNGIYTYTLDMYTNGNPQYLRYVGSSTVISLPKLTYRRLLLGDVNGDGKTDLITSGVYNIGSYNKDWYLYFSRGINGHFDDTGITMRSDFTLHEKDHFLLEDINGDGRADLTYLKYNSSGGYNVSTYLSYGSGINKNSIAEFSYTKKCKIIPATVALNHNHSQLLIVAKDALTKANFDRKENKQHLLTGAVNSYGVVNKTDYVSLNSGTNYQKGTNAAFPYTDFNGEIWAVSKNETYWKNKLKSSQSYSYSEAIFHKQGLGFAGFKSVNITDNLRTQTSSLQFDPVNYSTLVSEESPVHKVTHTYKFYCMGPKIDITPKSKVIFDKLKNHTVNYNYASDSYGNITGEVVDFGGGVTKRTSITYLNYPSGDNYCLGLPKIIQTQFQRDGKNEYTYTTISYNVKNSPINQKNYSYFGENNLTNETEWSYDLVGNVVSEKNRDYNFTNWFTVNYTYDVFGRKLLKVENNLGEKTEYTYGSITYFKYLPTSSKDQKGNITNFYYDNLGRLERTHYPSGVVSEEKLTWYNYDEYLYYVTKMASETPVKNVYYNAFGQDILSKVVGFNGKEIYTQKVYDNLGRLSKVSKPTYYGSSPSLWNTYTYDIYDRIIKSATSTGKISTYTYNGNSVTENNGGLIITRTYDSKGLLNSVTDAAGTIMYSYTPDDLPLTIKAPDNSVTSFEYDYYRRQTKINDPSAGTVSYNYRHDISNNNIITTKTDANNKSVAATVNYSTGLTTYISAPEFSTSFIYDQYRNLIREETSNGVIKKYEYDNLDRVKKATEEIDGESFSVQYIYSGDRISLMTYSPISSTPVVFSLNQYNHFKGLRFDGKMIYEIKDVNEYGQMLNEHFVDIQQNRNDVAIYHMYNSGIPYTYSIKNVSRNSILNSYEFTYNTSKGLLSNRRDISKNILENFSYDDLNRLKTWGKSGTTSAYNNYSNMGNITYKSDAGTMVYNVPSKPYAIGELTGNQGTVPPREQYVTYTSFSRPATISENGYLAEFTYTPDYDRIKMKVKHNDNELLTRYYFGGCYEMEKDANGNKTKEFLYIGGTPYDAPLVLSYENNKWVSYPILRDYLGNMIIAANDGWKAFEYSYDPWGRMRNPNTLQVYETEQQPVQKFNRGYGSHEYLPWFGLVNMNARLYDPVLGRFLMPDPYVQAPDFSQNFNRYTYALNNPLLYTDPSGEFFWLPVAIGAALGAYSGGVMANDGNFNPLKWDYGAGKTWGYMTGGAVVGGAAGYVGAAVATSGIPMANTASIASASLVNSFGTRMYTGGQTDISISFGAASYSSSSGWGFLGKKGNNTLQNMGYGLGALANFSDISRGFKSDVVQLQTEKIVGEEGKDLIGHSQILDENGNSLIDFGPTGDFYGFDKGRNNWIENASYGRTTQTIHMNGNKYNTPIFIKGVNYNNIKMYSDWLNKSPGFYNFILRSCSTQAARALTFGGVPVFGAHPYLLHFQISNGLRPYMFNYMYTKKH